MDPPEDAAASTPPANTFENPRFSIIGIVRTPVDRTLTTGPPVIVPNIADETTAAWASPPRHVRRFAVFFGDRRGPVRDVVVKPGSHAGICADGICGPVPRIAAFVAFAAQVVVVARLGFHHAVGKNPVVALEELESGFAMMHADLAGRIHAQALHPLAISHHVGLADEHRADVQRPQMIADVAFAHSERNEIGC